MSEMNWKDIRIKKRPHLPLVGEYVDNVLSEIASDQKHDSLATIQSCWSDIVSERIARVARPIVYRDGVLTLKVTSSVWRQELHSQSVTLITTINEKLPDINVGNIIFR